MKKQDIIKLNPDTLVWLKDHAYPFYFKRIENGKPILWGDFSSGMLGSKGYIESTVEVEDIIYPIPLCP